MPQLHRTARLVVGLISMAAMAVAITSGPQPAGAATPRIAGPFQPYFPPPFANTCTVHQYGEGVPPPLSLRDDPLCVEYAKRDITLSNGGAIRFLLAEPARLVIALPRCQYWQQDHWSIQVKPGSVAIISWDGNYWWDLGKGQAAAILGNLTIAGYPVNAQQAAAYIRPYSPVLADFFLAFGAHGPGGGFAGTVPFNPFCAK